MREKCFQLQQWELCSETDSGSCARHNWVDVLGWICKTDWRIISSSYNSGLFCRYRQSVGAFPGTWEEQKIPPSALALRRVWSGREIYRALEIALHQSALPIPHPSRSQQQHVCSKWSHSLPGGINGSFQAPDWCPYQRCSLIAPCFSKLVLGLNFLLIWQPSNLARLGKWGSWW